MKKWRTVQLKDVGIFMSGNGFPKKYQGQYQGKYPFYKVSDMNLPGNEKSMKKAINYIDEKERKKIGARIIPSNSIVFAKVGAAVYLERKRKTKYESCIDNNMMAFVPNEEILNINYAYYLFVNSKFSRFANVGALPSLNVRDLSKLKFKIPPLAEQQKIASILSTWDEAISLYSELLVNEKKKKKGLVEASHSYIAKEHSKDTMKVKLSDIIIEQNQRTTENNQYPVLSVTKEGIVLQEDYFNKQIASKDNRGYKIVEYGNVVFSTMNLWMGSLDVLRTIDKGIVSPAYKVFKLNEKTSDLNFMNEFLKSNKMIHLYKMNSEQGASVVRRNLDLKSLLSSYLNVPNLELQRKLGNLFYLQNKKIENIELLILQLQEQKRGLMQLLLTGKVRV